LESALRTRDPEALAAFGDDAIYIEKFVEKRGMSKFRSWRTRMEMQSTFGEQRMHDSAAASKVIEECRRRSSMPASAAWREAALKVIKAADYYNAGTGESSSMLSGAFTFSK
jgi:acetyl-CoA carboxylase biotin carboxylase subunit